MGFFDSSTGAVGKFIEKARRGEAAIGEMTEAEPSLQGDVRFDATGRQASVEPAGFVDDETFDTFRNAVSEVPAVSGGRRNTVSEDRLSEGSLPPDPRDVHGSRSGYAQAQDEARDAQITVSPSKYADDPDSYDFPGVDTGPAFSRTFGENPRSSALEKTQETAFGERELGGDLGELFDR